MNKNIAFRMEMILEHQYLLWIQVGAGFRRDPDHNVGRLIW